MNNQTQGAETLLKKLPACTSLITSSVFGRCLLSCSLRLTLFQPRGVYPAGCLCPWVPLARILDWVAVAFLEGRVAGRLYHWAARAVQSVSWGPSFQWQFAEVSTRCRHWWCMHPWSWPCCFFFFCICHYCKNLNSERAPY